MKAYTCQDVLVGLFLYEHDDGRLDLSLVLHSNGKHAVLLCHPQLRVYFDTGTSVRQVLMEDSKA